MQLSNKEYWDSIYKREKIEYDRDAPVGKLKGLINRILGERVLEYMRDYRDYLMWDVIFNKHMPKKEGASILEVGSAPGHFLLKLHKTFGFIPYGIEYSDIGVAINRELFILNNINPDLLNQLIQKSDKCLRLQRTLLARYEERTTKLIPHPSPPEFFIFSFALCLLL